MIIFCPNIFVMQYLQSTDQVTSEIESKAIGFMKTGEVGNSQKDFSSLRLFPFVPNVGFNG